MSVRIRGQQGARARQTRRTEQDSGHAASSANLGELPTEILLEIAKRAQAIAVVDATSPREEKSIPLQTPQTADSKKSGICQCPHSEPTTPFPVGLQTRSPANARIPLSSASRRLRQIMFVNDPEQYRPLRYCGCWMRASMEMPLQIRSGYRKLKIVAAREQANLPDDIQLIDYLAAFPNLETVDIRWHQSLAMTRHALRSVDPSNDTLTKVHTLQIIMFGEYGKHALRVVNVDASFELVMLVHHLQLTQVRTLRLKIEIPLISDDLNHDIYRIQNAFTQMWLPKLEEVTLDLLIEVDSLPEIPLATAMENTAKGILERHRVKAIHIRICLSLCANPALIDLVLTDQTTAAGYRTAYLPTQDELVKIAERLRRLSPGLSTLTLTVDAEVAFTPGDVWPTDQSILKFAYQHNPESIPHASEDEHSPSDTISTNGIKIDYEIVRQTIDAMRDRGLESDTEDGDDGEAG